MLKTPGGCGISTTFAQTGGLATENRLATKLYKIRDCVHWVCATIRIIAESPANPCTPGQGFKVPFGSAEYISAN